MSRQGSAQTQEELDEHPSYAYLKSQAVSLTGKEYTETCKCSLGTGYVSAGSGTEIVYPGVPKPKPDQSRRRSEGDRPTKCLGFVNRQVEYTAQRNTGPTTYSTRNRHHKVIEQGIVKRMEFANNDLGAV